MFPGKSNDMNLKSCKNSSEDDSTNNSSKNLNFFLWKLKGKITQDLILWKT